MTVEKLTERRVQALCEDASRRRPFAVRCSGGPTGFMLVVNRKSASYVWQGDLWRDRRLVKTVRVKVGSPETHSLKVARDAATDVRRQVRRGVDPMEARRPKGATLREAADAYVDNMRRRGRSERSIQDMKYVMARYLRRWADRPLAEIGADPRGVRQLHADLTRRHGPYCANGSMRILQPREASSRTFRPTR